MQELQIPRTNQYISEVLASNSSALLPLSCLPCAEAAGSSESLRMLAVPLPGFCPCHSFQFAACTSLHSHNPSPSLHTFPTGASLVATARTPHVLARVGCHPGLSKSKTRDTLILSRMVGRVSRTWLAASAAQSSLCRASTNTLMPLRSSRREKKATLHTRLHN